MWKGSATSRITSSTNVLVHYTFGLMTLCMCTTTFVEVQARGDPGRFLTLKF